jgi:uncharacterized membrane protein HdeD (DUF308 family)
VTIALLLLGPGILRRSRWALIALGLALTVLGTAICLQVWDPVTDVALEAFGWLLVVSGLGRLAFSFFSGGTIHWLLVLRGVFLVVLGIAIADFTTESGQALPWLFGSAMLLNGLYQALSALVIRYPRWGWFVALGALHLVAAGLLFFPFRHAVAPVVSLFLGAAVALLGLSALRTALRLERYFRSSHGGPAETAVRYYLDFHVAKRFHEKYLRGAPSSPPEMGQPHGDLLVHVWTPITASRLEQHPNLVSRYVAARDREGKFAVGHSALRMAPDVYISHCDGNPDAFEDSDEVWRTLRSKDVPGVFLPTYEEEVAHYLEPSATIRFRKFDEGQLRVFWALYRSVTDYNFTNRNCSVSVSMALEAALVGCLGSGKRIARLFWLLTNRDLWVAHFIRWKAREMVWTPGLMLDYARALSRVVEAAD